MINITLDHIALDVADRAGSAAFYHGLFGAEIVAEDRAHRLTLLRLPGSSRHADIALHEHPRLDAAYPSDQVRRAHTGWAVTGAADLVRGYDFFTRHTHVNLVAGFGTAWSVMGTDPDGHVVELQLVTCGAVDVQRRFELLDIDALRRATPRANPRPVRESRA